MNKKVHAEAGKEKYRAACKSVKSALKIHVSEQEQSILCSKNRTDFLSLLTDCYR